jgi:hypothetical protein
MSVRQSGKSVFRTFFVHAFWYSFDIWYIALSPYDTDQARVWSWYIHFSRSYGRWTLKNITNSQFSALFLFMLSDIHLILNTLLFHNEIQIRFEFGLDPLIFHKFMALGLTKISQILSFPHVFLSCFQIFVWYLVLCFVILRYRSSLNLILIHWFFTKLWPLDLEKYHKFSVFRRFFFRPFRYSFDTWYIALLYRDRD